MTDYRLIADDVRGIIEGVERTPDARTEPIAQAYAQACAQANARLRQCGDLLRRGLRSEALHLAQTPPELLDVVAALDVPGFAVWDNLCAQNDLTRAPRLLVETAAELNEAYAAEAPLKATLDDLRLLVLARAPAIERLHVVRKLKSLDPTTAHWAQDVSDLERAALDTLRADAGQILKAEDGPAARRLVGDLLAAEWTVEPPDDLVDALAGLAARSLVEDLAQAEASGDVRVGRRAMKALNLLLADRPGALAAAHAGTVGSATSWLAQSSERDRKQKAFAELCATLELESRETTPLAHLKALRSRLDAFGLPIPSQVLDAYNRSIAGRGGIGGMSLWVVVVATVLLLGLAWVATLLLHHFRA